MSLDLFHLERTSPDKLQKSRINRMIYLHFKIMTCLSVNQYFNKKNRTYTVSSRNCFHTKKHLADSCNIIIGPISRSETVMLLFLLCKCENTKLSGVQLHRKLLKSCLQEILKSPIERFQFPNDFYTLKTI